MEFRLWVDEKRDNVQKFPILDQSLTMAIINPHYSYNPGGCFEIWGIGATQELIFHKSENIEGLYKKTLENFNIIS